MKREGDVVVETVSNNRYFHLKENLSFTHKMMTDYLNKYNLKKSNYLKQKFVSALLLIFINLFVLVATLGLKNYF